MEGVTLEIRDKYQLYVGDGSVILNQCALSLFILLSKDAVKTGCLLQTPLDGVRIVGGLLLWKTSTNQKIYLCMWNELRWPMYPT